MINCCRRHACSANKVDKLFRFYRLNHTFPWALNRTTGSYDSDRISGSIPPNESVRNFQAIDARQLQPLVNSMSGFKILNVIALVVVAIVTLHAIQNQQQVTDQTAKEPTKGRELESQVKSLAERFDSLVESTSDPLQSYDQQMASIAEVSEEEKLRLAGNIDVSGLMPRFTPLESPETDTQKADPQFGIRPASPPAESPVNRLRPLSAVPVNPLQQPQVARPAEIPQPKAISPSQQTQAQSQFNAKPQMQAQPLAKPQSQTQSEMTQSEMTQLAKPHQQPAATSRTYRVADLAPNQMRSVDNQQAKTQTQAVQKDFDFESISREAIEMVAKADAMLKQGQIVPARRTLLSALQKFAAEYDRIFESTQHQQAFAEAIQTIIEAKDFRRSTRRSVADSIATHKTRLIDPADFRSTTKSVAMDAYHIHATKLLKFALKDSPFASDVLHSLGMCELLKNKFDSTQAPDPDTARALVASAWVVDKTNFASGQQFAKLLEERGQLNEAKKVLTSTLRMHSFPDGWEQLARVHNKLGEEDLALAAREEYESFFESETPLPSERLAESTTRHLDNGVDFSAESDRIRSVENKLAKVERPQSTSPKMPSWTATPNSNLVKDTIAKSVSKSVEAPKENAIKRFTKSIIPTAKSILVKEKDNSPNERTAAKSEKKSNWFSLGKALSPAKRTKPSQSQSAVIANRSPIGPITQQGTQPNRSYSRVAQSVTQPSYQETLDRLEQEAQAIVEKNRQPIFSAKALNPKNLLKPFQKLR